MYLPACKENGEKTFEASPAGELSVKFQSFRISYAAKALARAMGDPGVSTAV